MAIDRSLDTPVLFARRYLASQDVTPSVAREHIIGLAGYADRLKEKLEEVRGELFDACRLVARMHHAATGLDAPQRGVVEDCEDVAARIMNAEVIDSLGFIIRGDNPPVKEWVSECGGGCMPATAEEKMMWDILQNYCYK